MADGKQIYFSSDAVVVIDKRPCPFLKDRKLLSHEFRVVVEAALSVPAGILPQPATDRVGIAIKNYQSMDRSYRINILSLTGMPRNAVQDEHVPGRETGPVDRAGNDFPGQEKVLVLKQSAMFKDVLDERALGIGIEGRSVIDR